MSKALFVVRCSLFVLLCSCSLAPDFHLPKTDVPAAYKEQLASPQPDEAKGTWQPAQALAKTDRGQWWKIFNDTKLDALESQAAGANQSVKAAVARVEEARATVRANASAFLPEIDLGGNALRSQPPSADLAAFGQPAARLKPYTLYQTGATAQYEVDLFGEVRDTEKALALDADAQAALLKSVLLALQADVAQNYFALRSLDAERQLMRGAVSLRQEGLRIMQKRFDVGEVQSQDLARIQGDLATTEAGLTALDRQRAAAEHALAVLLGEMPSTFTFAEAALDGPPPQIPPGLPSTLLERRPDITAAQASMAAANKRIGVARTAYFPSLILTATGGTESVTMGDLFKWSSRTWALGQLAGSALSMTIFDNGRTTARVDEAKAAYEEAVANYRGQVLTAFRDVEDNLSEQRLLAEQVHQQEAAAEASERATRLTQLRYDEGAADYFEVIDSERTSLAAARSVVETRGQRYMTTVALIRALGGGWEEAVPEPAAQPVPQAVPLVESPAAPQPASPPVSQIVPLVEPPAEPAAGKPLPLLQ